MKTTTLAAQYLEARAARDAAEEAMRSLEAKLKQRMENEGTPTIIVGEHSITLVHSHRSSVDAEALKGLVNASLFKKLTTIAVDGRKFAAACKLGDITSDIADQVTTFTEFDALRVR